MPLLHVSLLVIGFTSIGDRVTRLELMHRWLLSRRQ
jgi:hypothetical protein